MARHLRPSRHQAGHIFRGGARRVHVPRPRTTDAPQRRHRERLRERHRERLPEEPSIHQRRLTAAAIVRVRPGRIPRVVHLNDRVNLRDAFQKRRRDVAEQTRVVPAPDAGVHAVHGVITRTELAVLTETGRGDTGQAQGRTGRDARCLQILPRGWNLLAMRGGVLRDRLVEFDRANDGPRARRRGARGGDREGDGGRESREG
mmetsp:Transcript_11955/g.54190  ORF Transcript_11955/g.54190 Transcript_11955/m.54190 type:complete len:203 (+) Transcript_11955:567-1175(+)